MTDVSNVKFLLEVHKIDKPGFIIEILAMQLAYKVMQSTRG